MKKFTILAAVVALIGCTQNDEGLDNITSTLEKSQTEFYASMPECNTRTYVEDNKYLRWNAGDEITVFAGNSYNGHWQFAGEDGANSGKFNEISEDGFVTGTPLDLTANYAIYPYDENISISQAGVVSLTLPAVQEYNHAYENSFGAGANTMMAVTKNTSDNFLSFKNLCGYLKLKFYGNDVTVKSISVKGNNGEKIAGKATVSMAYGSEPTITMGGDATDTITIDCGEGVALSNDAANPTTFWVAIPEITFEGGITIEVTDINDQTFEKKTTNTVPIENNLIQPMAALGVEFTPTEIPETWKIYYSATAKIQKYTSKEYFGANMISNEWDEATGEGVMTFDGKVIKIGSNAFSYCKNLTNIEIPKSVTTIEYSAFSGCGLTSVNIPENVKSIGNNAFGRNSNLLEVYIPESVEEVGNTIFYNCKNIRKYEGKFASEDGIYFIVDGVLQSVVRNEITDYIIPYGVVKIEKNLFSGHKELTSVVIPDGVTSIETYAFSGCTSLTSIKIPDSVTHIGEEAFSGCSNLRDITIGKSVTHIGTYAFETGTQPIIRIKDIAAWCNINFGAHWYPSWKYQLYINGHTLGDLVIPEEITSIGKYSFKYSLGLTSVCIHDNVTSIGAGAFESSSIKSAIIGSGVIQIGSSAFSNCTLEEIYCKPTLPPNLEGSVFANFPGSFYVPMASVDIYKSTECWREYNYDQQIFGYDFIE